MRIKLINIMFFFYLAGLASAQDFPKRELTFKSVWNNFRAPNNDQKGVFRNLSPAIELGYSYNFSQHFSLDIPIRMGLAHFPIYSTSLKEVTGYTANEFYSGMDALISLHLLKGRLFAPFAYAGIGGATHNEKHLFMQAPVGIGVDLKLNKLISLEFQTDYRLAFKNGFNNWQHAFGLKISLGGQPKDIDMDGFPDKKDLCPEVFGTVSGCPDSDGDGIADKDDRCISLAGVADNMGCPADTDQDGVYDVDDQCPILAGTVRGCPDRDRDGVADQYDKCPEAPGKASNAGCPETAPEEKKALEVAIKSIQFETGSAAISELSIQSLDAIYQVLQNYPEMKLSIEGHTDNIEAGTVGKQLSEKRASVCADYLIQKGISATRLMTQGFGDTIPIGDNKTPAARSMNRRTEFNPVLR